MCASAAIPRSENSSALYASRSAATCVQRNLSVDLGKGSELLDTVALSCSSVISCSPAPFVICVQKAAGPKVGQSQDKGAAALLFAATSPGMSGAYHNSEGVPCTIVNNYQIMLNS